MKNDIFELLKCIEECPDTFITKPIMFNVLKNWSYGKLNAVLKTLVDKDLVLVHSFNYNDEYSVSPKGKIYINDYLNEKDNIALQKKKNLFSQFTFPIILAIISFILGLLTNYLFK